VSNSAESHEGLETVSNEAAFLLADMPPVDIVAEERWRINLRLSEDPYLAFLPFRRPKSRKMKGKPPFPAGKGSGVPLTKPPEPTVSYQT